MENYVNKSLKDCDFSYSNDEIEKIIKSFNYNCTKYTILKGKIYIQTFGTTKKRRVNIFTLLLKNILQINKYKNINVTFFLNTDDWGSHEKVKHLPILMYSANIDSKNILVPDYLFLHNYNVYGGRNKNSEPANKIVDRLNNTVPFDKKNNKCFFRAGTSKNKYIIQMFPKNKVPYVDADWSKNDFMSYEDMFKHKFVISHFMKWDSIYFFLKSDILLFNYTGFNYHLWYDLFLENNIDYVSFKNKQEFDSQYNELIHDNNKCKNIINHSSKIADLWFTYDKALEYVGDMLLILQHKMK